MAVKIKPRDFLKEVIGHLRDSDLQWIAGSLAFSTVLSLVPFFALTLSVFQSIGGLEFLEPKVQSLMLQYFRQAVGGEATTVLRKIIMRLQPGTIGITSALFLLVTSLKLLQDIEKGISRMWERKVARSFGRRVLVSWALLVIFTFFLAIYTGFRSMDFVKPFAKANKELLDFAVVGFGLFLFYKFLPPAQVRWRSALFSALTAGIALVALQGSFALITKAFFQHNKIYGSLAAIPLLLTWVLFVWYVILAGAALTASIDKALKLKAKITDA